MIVLEPSYYVTYSALGRGGVKIGTSIENSCCADHETPSSLSEGAGQGIPIVTSGKALALSGLNVARQGGNITTISDTANDTSKRF